MNSKNGNGRRHGHQLIASDLIQRLEKGEWKIGDKFPSIDELTQEYEYSRCTVTKAIQELIGSGFLRARKSVGTFVEKVETGRSIGIVVGEEVLKPQQSPFSYLLTRKISEILKNHGCSVSRFIEEKGDFVGDEHIDGFRQALASRRLDALITLQCNLPQYINSLSYWQQYSIPHLCVASIANNVPHQVTLDHSAFLEQSCAFLQNCGIRNVAIIDSGTDKKLLKQIMSKYRLKHHPEWVCEVVFKNEPNTEKAGFECMTAIYDCPDKPEALIVTDDIVMKGVALAVVKLNINIPEQLRIIHLANSDTEIFFPFKTSRVEYNISEIALCACDYLTKLLKHPNMEPQPVTIKPKLIIS